jgi:hypothetical protein
MSEPGNGNQNPGGGHPNDEENAIGEQHPGGAMPINHVVPANHVAPDNADEADNADAPDHSIELIRWEFDIEYDDIKHAPWKADVYQRLLKVQQDIRHAISAQGWTAAEGAADDRVGKTLTVRVTAPHGQPTDKAPLDVMRGVAKSAAAAANCLTRTSRRTSPPGGNLMSAYISLHAAEADSLLLLDADQLKAKLPSVYEQAVAYLSKGDKRITAVTNLMSPSAALNPSADGCVAWEALTYANKKEDQQQLQVRDFRTTLGASFIVALAVAVGLGFAAHFHPAYFPFCVLKAASKTALICPSGGSQPSASDAPLVMGMGALGGILSFVISLSVINPPGVRYSLSAVQGLLKVALGALTAVLGIMVLSTLLSTDSSVLNSQLKLLVAAAVFGYSQQLFTSVLDRKGTNLQDAAAGK